MKRFALPALLALAGCDSSAISKCEDKIKEELLSPASYQRVDAQIDEQSDMIRIEFDADNALGVPLRDEWDCPFTRKGGSINYVGTPRPSLQSKLRQMNAHRGDLH